MQMVDKDGNVQEIPDEQAADAFRSGKYGFQEGAKIPVANEAGTIGSIDAAEASQKFAQPGLQTVSQEAFEKAARTNKYGTDAGAAAAFGINAGDALTLGFGKGLATQAAGALGGEEARKKTAEYIEGTDTENPNAAFAGQVVGTAAPILAGGFEGLAGKGIRGVGAGVRGVDTLGTIAEHGIASLVGEGAENFAVRAAQKAAAFGARGAVEGSIYGAGSAYSEAVLKNEDLTAERIMSGAAHGAIMGGEIGAGIGGATSLAGTAFQKIADTLVPKLRDSLNEFAEARAIKAAGGNKTWVKKAMNRAGGTEEIGKDLLARGHINYDSTIESIADSVSKDASEQGSKLGTMMGELDAKAATTEGAHLVDGNKILQRAADEVIAPMRANPAMRDVAEQLEKRLVPYAEDFAGKEVGFKNLWDIRKGLDQRINWESRAQSPLADGLKDFRRILETELTDSADKAARDLGISETFQQDWKETKRLYSSMAFARDMTEDALAGKAGNRFLSLTDNLAGGFGASSYAGAHGGAGAGLGVMSMLNPAAAASGVITAGVHKVLRERGSSIMAAAADRLAKVGTAAAESHHIESKVVEAVEQFLEHSSVAGEKTAHRTLDQAIADPHAPGSAQSAVVQSVAKVFGTNKEPKNLTEHYNQAAAAVSHLSGDAVAAHDHIEQSIAPLAKAQPVLAMKVAAKQTNAIKFLQSKLPPSSVSTPLSPTHPPSVSDLDKASFLRTLRAVKHPLSVVDDMKDGKVPSREAVEALKNVWPETYEDLKGKVLDRVAELDGDLPYQKKLIIGRLFDTAVDPTQRPEIVAAVKNIYASQGQAPTSADQLTTPGGGGSSRNKIDTAGAMETKANSLEKGLS